MRFISRVQAAQAAHRKGIQAFSCRQLSDGNWTYNVEAANKTLTDALRWAKDKDFVSHIEMHDNEAILVVTCFREDFADMVVPFKVAPVTPSLWVAADKEIERRANSRETGKYERSTALSPVALAFSIYDDNKDKSKRELVELAMAQGIHKNTANAQYYRWKAARNL